MRTPGEDSGEIRLCACWPGIVAPVDTEGGVFVYKDCFPAKTMTWAFFSTDGATVKDKKAIL